MDEPFFLQDPPAPGVSLSVFSWGIPFVGMYVHMSFYIYSLVNHHAKNELALGFVISSAASLGVTTSAFFFFFSFRCSDFQRFKGEKGAFANPTKPNKPIDNPILSVTRLDPTHLFSFLYELVASSILEGTLPFMQGRTQINNKIYRWM